jgi:hypothetical protein
MFIFNGKKIDISKDLIIDDVVHPAGNLLNAELRAQLGITEVPDPIRPDERIYWVSENEDGTYTSTPKDWNMVTDPVWQMIKAKREFLKISGIKVGENWFKTDIESRQQYQDICAIGDSFDPVDNWSTMDGAVITMDYEKAKEIVKEISIFNQNVRSISQSHKVAMEASSNPYAYDYSTGWPEVYSPE